MNKIDFMNMVKDILEEADDHEIIARGKEMKKIIDNLVQQELNFAKANIR